MVADRFKIPIISLWNLAKYLNVPHPAPEFLVNSWVRPESIDIGRYVPLFFGRSAIVSEIFKQTQRLVYHGVGSEGLCQQRA